LLHQEKGAFTRYTLHVKMYGLFDILCSLKERGKEKSDFFSFPYRTRPFHALFFHHNNVRCSHSRTTHFIWDGVQLWLNFFL